MSNMRRDFNNRQTIHTSGRLGRTTRFEYVNRLGERVSPSTGKPYERKENSSKENASQRRNGKKSLPVKKSGAMFGGLDPIPTDPSCDPPPRTCFNCWQPGHSRRNCPRAVITRICNNCGRRGEDLRSCPRCSRAHQRYLKRLQARERGEDVEPEEIDPIYEASEDNEEERDEVLRELIYQDQRTRELALQQGRECEFKNNYSEPEINMTIYQEREPNSLYSVREIKYQETELESYYQRERGSKPYYEQREDKSYYEPRNDKPFYEQQEDKTYYEQRNYKPYYEQHDDKSLFREREQERDLGYKEASSIGINSRKKSESPMRNDIKHSIAAASTVTNSDPVQDILLLAKTIAHLSSETQDLIMRQVIFERKEKARQRAIQEREEDVWP